MKTRAWNLATVALVSFWLLTPAVIGLTTPDRKKSISENRNLAQRPGWPTSAEEVSTWIQDITAYLRDQIGLRETLTNMHALALYQMGVSASPRVVIGQEKMLFNRTLREPDDLLRQVFGLDLLSDKQTKEIVNNWQENERQANEFGAIYLSIIVPNKAVIHRDKLPQHMVNRVSDKRMLQQLVAESRRVAPTSFLDVSEALIKESHQHQVWLRDDSHWNSVGAWTAYKAIADEINLRAGKPLLRLTDDDVSFDKATKKPGDIARLLGLGQTVREVSEVVTLNRNVPEIDKRVKKIKGTVMRIRFKTRLKDAPRILIMSDSFIWKILPFLRASASEIIWIRNGNQQIPWKTVSNFRPDIILTLNIEKTLTNNIWEKE